MRSRDIRTTLEMDMAPLKDAYRKTVDCELSICEDLDQIVIYFKGMHGGGVLHYLSDHSGIMISHEDHSKVIGIFFDNFLREIEVSDEQELSLRKFRYYEGEILERKQDNE